MENEHGSWQGRRENVKRKWQVPFVYAEWCCEHLSDRLNRWAFIDILERIGHLAIIVGIVFYLLESPERKMARQYQPWQVVNSARGQAYSGGREYALQELNRDGVSMVGIDLARAILPNLKLPNATLVSATLEYADLRGANLSGSDLSLAQLEKCELGGVDLSHARLVSTNLEGAHLEQASLSGADLTKVKLSDASLKGANLSDTNCSDAYLSRTIMNAANLRHARLAGADLAGTSFGDADLSGADLSRTDLRFVDLSNVRNWQAIKDIRLANLLNPRNAPQGFVEWAKQHGAISMSNEGEWRKLVGRE